MTDKLTPVRLAISRERIVAYAEISNDFNPIHVDPEFARQSPMGGIIAHGTMSLNLIWQALEQTFGGPDGRYYITEIRFRVPVREDDVVEAGGERISSDAFQVWVRNQDGVTVIDGVATIHAQGKA